MLILFQIINHKYTTRAGFSAKIFETETRHWRYETETLAKMSRRDRDL